MEVQFFNATLWQKQMAARHREEYTERRDNTYSGPDGGPVQVSSVTRTIIDPKAGKDTT
ncbi:unnamed protein product [marine sediment metagenome]|uniref:Uncharacterized protein n=1 Tax=marine sediment metagenome TaxID=412755 RepID=X0TUV3_9ZZZZ